MKIILSTTTALAILCAAPAYAQTAVDADIVVTAQQENRTQVSAEGDLGALGQKDAMDVPFSVRSYNEALILNQQPQTLGQVLENDPTIRTSYGFGNASEQFVIRGFELFGDDVGLNGLYGIAPRQLIAPELFQNVQVLNGASAFLNGAAPGGSGTGGSVSLQLKRAGATPLNRVTFGYTGDTHFGGSVDVSRRFGTDDAWGLRVNGAYRGGDIAIDNEYRRTTVVGGALDYDGSEVRFSLDLAYQDVEVRGLRHKVTLLTNAIPEVPDASANYAQPWTYTEMRDIFGVARLEYDFAENATAYVTAGARDGREEGIYGGLNLTDATTGAATGNALFVPRTDNNYSVETGARVKLGDAVTHEFNIGGNMSWETNRNAFDFLYGPGFAGFPTNLYNPPVATIPASAFVGGDLDNPFPIARNQLWSVFASDTVGLFDERMLITAGLRLQNIEVKAYNYYNGGLLDSVYDENAVTPVFGVVVKPTQNLSFFANRIESLQQGPTAPLDPLLINSGAVFAPFKSVQYEAGGKVRVGGMDASVTLYHIDQPSAYSVPVDAANPTGPQIFGLFGEQRNRGVEFTVSGTVGYGLSLIGGFSIVDAKLRNTAGGLNEGKKAVGVPDFTANANAEWDLPFVPGLTLTGRVVYTGEQPANADNSLMLDDWTRVDLGARYVVAVADRPVTLRLTVDNVTDEAYWASAFDAFSVALLQGQPRTVKASISIDF